MGSALARESGVCVGGVVLLVRQNPPAFALIIETTRISGASDAHATIVRTLARTTGASVFDINAPAVHGDADTRARVLAAFVTRATASTAAGCAMLLSNFDATRHARAQLMTTGGMRVAFDLSEEEGGEDRFTDEHMRRLLRAVPCPPARCPYPVVLSVLGCCTGGTAQPGFAAVQWASGLPRLVALPFADTEPSPSQAAGLPPGRMCVGAAGFVRILRRLAPNGTLRVLPWPGVSRVAWHRVAGTGTDELALPRMPSIHTVVSELLDGSNVLIVTGPDGLGSGTSADQFRRLVCKTVHGAATSLPGCAWRVPGDVSHTVFPSPAWWAR